MNWKPTQLGADPKKIGILIGLLLVAAYFYISGRQSDASVSTPRVQATGGSPAAAVPAAVERPANRSGRNGRLDSGLREFRPSLKVKVLDASSIDPTLHLGLLAKLREVQPEVGSRSLFEIGSPPPPPAEIAKIKEPAKIKVAAAGPVEPPKPPPPPPAPKAPPIPLKFYGFVNPSRADNKRAFFLDGDDIIIAGEGDTIKKRYRVIRIGVNSAVMEDTQFKSNNQQTLPLETEIAG